MTFLQNHSPLSLDVDFNNDIDHHFGRKLPVALKANICKLVDQFSFSSGLSINMDVNSMNGLPDEMKTTFSKLLKHIYSSQSRSEKLVLELLRLIGQSFDAFDNVLDHSQDVTPPNDAVPSERCVNENNSSELPHMTTPGIQGNVCYFLSFIGFFIYFILFDSNTLLYVFICFQSENVVDDGVLCSQYEIHKSVHFASDVGKCNSVQVCSSCS